MDILNLYFLRYNSIILFNIFSKIIKNKNKNNLKIYEYIELKEEKEQNLNNFNFKEYDVNLCPDKNYIYIGENYITRKMDWV